MTSKKLRGLGVGLLCMGLALQAAANRGRHTILPMDHEGARASASRVPSAARRSAPASKPWWKRIIPLSLSKKNARKRSPRHAQQIPARTDWRALLQLERLDVDEENEHIIRHVGIIKKFKEKIPDAIIEKYRPSMERVYGSKKYIIVNRNASLYPFIKYLFRGTFPKSLATWLQESDYPVEKVAATRFLYYGFEVYENPRFSQPWIHWVDKREDVSGGGSSGASHLRRIISGAGPGALRQQKAMVRKFFKEEDYLGRFLTWMGSTAPQRESLPLQSRTTYIFIDQQNLIHHKTELDNYFEKYPQIRLMLTLTQREGEVHLAGDELPAHLQHLLLIDMERSVRQIKGGFLQGNGNLRSASFMGFEKVECIEDSFMQDMAALKCCNVQNLKALHSVGDACLANCPLLQEFAFSSHAEVRHLGANYLAHSTGLSLTNVDALMGLKKLPDGFMRNTGLPELNLEDLVDLTEIGNNVLRDAKALRVFDLSRSHSLITIGDNFLFGCPVLREISLGSLRSVNAIGDNFCRGAVRLERLLSLENYIPIFNPLHRIDLSSLVTVQQIGSGFLQDCRSMPKIFLAPFNHLRILGEDFLKGCACLKDLRMTFPHQLEVLPAGFIEGCASLKSINRYVKADWWHSMDPSDETHPGTSHRTKEFKLKRIGQRCAAGCTNLRVLDFSQCKNLEYIEIGLVKGCRVIERVLLPHGKSITIEE